MEYLKQYFERRNENDFVGLLDDAELSEPLEDYSSSPSMTINAPA